MFFFIFIRHVEGGRERERERDDFFFKLCFFIVEWLGTRGT
jgi:hypothetical protein